MSATEPLLEVNGLTLRFGNGRGLHGVDLTAPRNSITGFIGVNGAGKSTTLRCILGLLRPEAGSVRLFGRAADPAARRRLGFLPEERGLFAGDRARDVIAFNARLRGIPKNEAYRRADSLLDRIGLGGREREPIGSLSKGNAQRVQLLCALGHSPDMLILDEPLSGLDPMAQNEVLALFAEFRSGGGSILFSTHTMAAAESVCDRVVILSNGRTAFEGPVAEAARQAPYGAVVVTDDEAGLRQAVAAVRGEVRPLSDPGARFGSAAR
ncbi:MAG TPA: ATP-binding cassette domain-containing protein, partial [Brevundimonas sp.]|nr:ATP-binding cassette domain-containing protein [Brevundimonas sp.]